MSGLEFILVFASNGACKKQGKTMTDYKTPEKITVDHHADGVSCDGGGGALGHPKVWYGFDGQDSVECGYCDRLFVKSS